MAADGSIVIVADVDDKKAQAELNRLAKKIDDLNKKISEGEAAQSPLVEQAENLRTQIKEATAEVEKYKQQWLSGVGGADQDEMAARARVAELQAQYDELLPKIQKYDDELRESNELKDAAIVRAGELSAKLAGVNAVAQENTQAVKETSEALQEAGESGAQAGAEISEAMNHAASRVEKLGKRILGLAKRVFVFSVITTALRSVRTWLVNTVKANSEAATAIGNLKGAFLTLAQPILNAVIPAFTAFANILTTVISAIASVVSLLGGTTAKESADAAEALNEEAEGLGKVGGAAGKAMKQLAGFDEINRLAESGGGGGAAASDAITPLFDAIRDFELPDWLEELATNLKLTIDDVFFEWENLTGEQIAEKAIVGIAGLAGAVAGFAIGGVPGAIIGTLTGVAIGLVIDSLVFDHDGQLNSEEVIKLIIASIGALAGGVIGFSVGGVGGAAIGILVGASLTIVLDQIVFDGDGELNEEEIGKLLLAAGIGVAGGIIGFGFGGPGGAAIGLIVGASLGILIGNVTFNGDKIVDPAEKLMALLGFESLAAPGGLELIMTVANVLITLSGIRWIFEKASQVWEDAKTWIRENIVDPFVSNVKSLFGIDEEGKSSVTNNIGSSVISGFFQGISDFVSNVRQWIDRWIVTPFLQAIKSLFGIDEGNAGTASATATYDLGNRTIVGFFRGIYYYVINVVTWVKRWIVDPFLQAIKSLFGISEGSDSAAETQKVGATTIRGFLQGILNVFANIWTWISTNIVTPFLTYMKSLFGIGSERPELLKIGQDIIYNFLNGLKNVWSSVTSWARSAISELTNILNPNVADIRPGTFGGGGFGSTSSVSRVPGLATGAVIPPNREFLAVLGDQKNGTNIEAPQAELQAMANQAASANAAYLERIISILQEGKVLVVDDTTFARLVYNTNRNEVSRHGGKLVNVTGRV